MPMKGQYVNIERAAEFLGASYTGSDLIHLGVNEILPIYILASDWDVEAKHWEIRTLPDDDGYPTEVLMCLEPQKVYVEKLNGPIKLDKSTILKFELNMAEEISRFFVRGNDGGGNPQLSEYWFNPNASSKKQGDLVVNVSSLRVMVSDIDRFKSPLLITTALPEYSEYKKPKRKAPDAFVSALIKLLVQIATRAAENGLPFDVTAMPGIKEDFRALALKVDAEFKHTPKTFDDYLAGLCQFKQGAKSSTFYLKLFPELQSNAKITGET